jgi:SAM-dependent methyltransferase
MIPIIRRMFKKNNEPNSLYRMLFFPTFNSYVYQLIKRNVSKTDRLLDVGSRKLTYTKNLKCRQIVAVDMKSATSGYLGWTESFLTEMKNRISIIRLLIANAEDLPIKDGKLDIVILIEVIEHIKNDEKAISEISRVLGEKGRLILSTPNKIKVPNENPFHFRHYEPVLLEGILRKYFKNVKIWTKFPYTGMHVKQIKYGNKISKMTLICFNKLLNLSSFIFHKYSGYSLFAYCEFPTNKE